MDIRIMRHAACRPGSAVEFSQGCDGFLFVFAMGVHCLFFENLRSVDLPDALTFTRLLRSDHGLLLLQFYVSIAKCVYETKESKAHQIGRNCYNVTKYMFCKGRTINCVVPLYAKQKLGFFLTYINIKLLYIKQKLIFQVSTREILVFLYYGIKTFSDIGVK